jgi:hypothetical protein
LLIRLNDGGFIASSAYPKKGNLIGFNDMRVGLAEAAGMSVAIAPAKCLDGGKEPSDIREPSAPKHVNRLRPFETRTKPFSCFGEARRKRLRISV